MNKLTGVVHREYHTAVVERLEQRIAELEARLENAELEKATAEDSEAVSRLGRNALQ